jgi:bis(5'-nucleosidyl)-tetraphosphatase
VNPELGHPEHTEFRWVSCAEAQELLPARLHPVLRWAWQTILPGA